MSQASSLGAASPYNIGGNLSFGTVPGPLDYQSAYANALSLNQQNYANILSGYQGLSSSVLGNLQGIDQSQRQAITDQYAQQKGQAAQGLISRGLGNTTVSDSVQRGLALDKAKADIALTNQTQQLYAGYQSNLGLAQLGFMNSIRAPYPNAEMYSRLAMMQGMAGRRYGGFGGAPMRTSAVGAPSSGSGMGNQWLPESPGSPMSYGGFASGLPSNASLANMYGNQPMINTRGVVSPTPQSSGGFSFTDPNAPDNPYTGEPQYGDNSQQGGVDSGAFDPENWQEGGTATWEGDY